MEKPKWNGNLSTRDTGCFVQIEWKICFLFSAELSGLLFIGDAILQVSELESTFIYNFIENWNKIYTYEM